MKRIILGLIIATSFSSCQKQEKVAFIDNGKVINDYQMKIDLEEEFKAKDEAFKKKTDSIGQAFQIEAQAFNLAAAKMSKKAQQEKYQELGQKQQILQQQIQYEQQIMQQAFNTEMDSVILKVNDFVEDYGKSNGYTFIFGKNQAGSVLYGEEAKDITEIVIKAINDSYSKKDNKETDEASAEDKSTKE
ncbi:OmpH family outer membrane protein [uncultured Winogradskyella sp.]|uniref:OmpH family outer membrane protein n=1 Tax=uncultured Winogradskyella sp. TaxID=395353 RepID=UPI00261A86EB|nr:OmpH family outer membrane protein [uncultured Winogradskyella sp.]